MYIIYTHDLISYMLEVSRKLSRMKLFSEVRLYIHVLLVSQCVAVRKTI